MMYMSFTSEKRDQIKKYILEKIDDGQKDVAKEPQKLLMSHSIRFTDTSGNWKKRR